MQRKSKNIDRNRSLLNHLRQQNDVAPELLLMNRLWMQEDVASGVKIVELSPSGSSQESTSSTKTYSHAWSYANNGGCKDKYVNKAKSAKNTVNRQADYSNDQAVQSDSFNDSYDSEYSPPPKILSDYFMILKNNINLKSESSADNEIYQGIEVIEMDNSEETSPWDHVYKDQNITNSPNEDKTRTVWIYSYKNKHLSENDYEMESNLSKNSSNTCTSCSISEEELKAATKVDSTRLGSPIPSYIPRLDLSVVKTLSTVTEISETNKCSKALQDKINWRPRNNQLIDKTDNRCIINNTNIVNWLGLSPRHRRRRSINTDSEVIRFLKERMPETTFAEGTLIEQSEKYCRNNTSSVQVQTDISFYENLASISSHRSTKKTKVNNLMPIDIPYAENIDDHKKVQELCKATKPTIDITTKLDKTKISDPMKKLDSGNWICEETIEKETVVYDYDLEGVDAVTGSTSKETTEDSTSNRVYLKNLPMLKSGKWTEYLPITCSPPSLHLSMSLGSLSDNRSWFKRLVGCVKCCK